MFNWKRGRDSVHLKRGTPPPPNEVAVESTSQAIVSKTVVIEPRRPAQLANTTQHRLDWLWHGYLGRGKLTAFISPPKMGKTTLLTHVLARLAHGGSLADLPVAPGHAA